MCTFLSTFLRFTKFSVDPNECFEQKVVQAANFSLQEKRNLKNPRSKHTCAEKNHTFFIIIHTI